MRTQVGSSGSYLTKVHLQGKPKKGGRENQHHNFQTIFFLFGTRGFVTEMRIFGNVSFIFGVNEGVSNIFLQGFKEFVV